MTRMSACLVLLLVACGDGENATPDAAEIDAPPARTCDESVAWTTRDQPPCTWAWTCNDHAGALPQFAADCVAGNNGNVTCQCMEQGRGQTGTMTLQDGCISFADACAEANLECGFSVPIACPP